MAMAMATIARRVSRVASVGIAATGATVLRAVSVEIAVTVRRVASAPIVTSAQRRPRASKRPPTGTSDAVGSACGG